MSDDLLAAWDETLARRSDARAIGDTRGEVVRTFAQIAAEAAELERGLDELAPGSVIGIQIGNHPAWPAWLLASWRRRLVVLPLEEEMAEEERAAALQVCRAAALVTLDPGGEIRLTRRNARGDRMGKSFACAPEIDFRNNGRAARDPLPQRATAGRLPPNL